MTNFPTADVLNAVVARIEATGESPNEYDVLGILGTIVQDYGVDVADVNDHDFLRLLTRNALEDKTELPCPSWCPAGPGHPFESHNLLTNRQTRPHELTLAAGEGVYVALTQDDEREKGDDSTAVRGAPFVVVAIEGDLDAASLRRRAADLLNAADKLDALAGAGARWTEDEL